MIVFIDLEASSLEPGGFPIEVAWVDENGQGETHLIRPAPGWLTSVGGQPVWSSDSEALHGISLDTLMQNGILHTKVAYRVKELLQSEGLVFVSDAPNSDSHWLRMLLASGKLDRKVVLQDVQTVYGLACRPLLSLVSADDGLSSSEAQARVRDAALSIVARAEEDESLRPRLRHRAWTDAEGLLRTWRAVRADVGRRMEGKTLVFRAPAS